MPTYTLKLTRQQEVAEGTFAFYFEKPAEFVFQAGQSMDLTLVNPPETDDEGNTRAFSIASAPAESQIMIATRMRDTAFKRVLKALPPGGALRMEGPFGDMTLHNNAARPAVFLAGGIGITPFRSIVCRAAEEKLPHRLFLFYSNRRSQDAPFLTELRELQTTNPHYTLIDTVSAATQTPAEGPRESGRITSQMLTKYVGHLNGPVYYIAGPPAMVHTLRQVLNSAGVNDDDIRAEEFSGY